MQRKAFVIKLLTLLAFIASSCNSKKLSVKKENNKPNVVFILVDDLGWMDLSIMGSDFYHTPNIDKLSKDGVLFTDAYSACTVCSPTRASIMTGKYPAKIKVTDWIEGWDFPHAKLAIPNWVKHLPKEEKTMAEVFKDNGYKTAHIGKWHLGELEEDWAEHHGFDINIAGWRKGSPNRDKNKGYNGYFPPFGNPKLQDRPSDSYLTDRIASEAIHFIENNKLQPFFLNLWFYAVHTPLQAQKEKVEKYNDLVNMNNKQNNPTYAAMIEHMDDAVGNIIAKLKELKLYDKSIIVFTSDNGGLIGGKKQITNNYPLRSGKGDMYEGGVRVPAIVKNSQNTNAGIVNKIPITSIDYLPTLVDLAGIIVNSNIAKEWDGVSLLKLLTKSDATIERDAIFWHYPHYHIEGAKPYSAMRKGKWKLVNIIEDDTYELYNLETDISEEHDLSNENKEILAVMKREMQNWRLNIGAQMPTSNPKYNPAKKR